MSFKGTYPDSPLGNFKIIDVVGVPHPYCITNKHLEYSDSMYLDIEGAEKKGASCGICDKPHSEHEQALLVECAIEMVDGKDELHEWLLSIKDEATANGYVGFSFIKREVVLKEKEGEVFRNYAMPNSYHIDKSPGCGCAGEPPGHPRYFVKSIYNRHGNSPPHGQPQYYLNGNGYTKLEGVDKLFKPLPLEHPRTQEWIANTFRHHRHCYQDPFKAAAGGTWSDNMIIYPVPSYDLRKFRDDERFSEEWREKEKAAIERDNQYVLEYAEKIAIPTNHDATILVRRHYPEFNPTYELLNNPPQVVTTWWERLEEKPTPETCPGDASLRMKHPVGGNCCQVCGWRKPEEEVKECQE